MADNFGYNLNAFYTLFQLDSQEVYRTATIKALGVLADKYRSFDWENGSADGYADAIEGALNLYNREPVESVADWMDTEMKVMWLKQGEDGVIEGWHGDGNFARTTIMYCLWKTKGLSIHPWRDDLQIGAEVDGDTLWISLKSDTPWSGFIKFDKPRHSHNLHLPYDWPRINQFPEWFTVENENLYRCFAQEDRDITEYVGSRLVEGMPIEVNDGELKIKLWLNNE